MTRPGLPYSLWALPDASGWLGWVPRLVRLWGTQNTRSLHLEISRFTIRVYVGPPLGRARSLVAVGPRLFGASLATLIVLTASGAVWRCLGRMGPSGSVAYERAAAVQAAAECPVRALQIQVRMWVLSEQVWAADHG